MGGLTSYATSWANLRTQMRDKYRNKSRSRRQQLYKEFIEEAAKIYGDSLILANFSDACRQEFKMGLSI